MSDNPQDVGPGPGNDPDPGPGPGNDPGPGNSEPEALDLAEEARPHGWLRIWAELAGAWAISLAYPIYVNIASGPEALTSYGLRRFDVLILIGLVSLLGPALITLAELILRRISGERPRRIVHGLIIGLLLGLVLWRWLLETGVPAVVRGLLPVAVAGLTGWLYERTELIRNFALMLSFATLVVIGAFAVDYPIRDELLPHEAKTATPGINRDTPVVLVVFDELPLAALERPDGKIDPRFRTFSMLSRKATWYPDAISVADQTTFALPSILTGQNPYSAGGNKPPSPGLANYPDSICRIAGDGGYRIHAYEPVTDLCPSQWGLGTKLSATLSRAVGVDDPFSTADLVPGGLDERVARAFSSLFPQPWGEYREGRREAFRQFNAKLPGGQRSLSVLHIALPHVHWIYSPDGTTYDELRPSTDPLLINPPTGGENDRNAQQMLLQLAFTDRELGRLVARMKAEGTWDESIFIVTADHGAGFQPNGSRRILDIRNAGWVVPVPLFIKFPGQERGKLVTGTVDGRDIVPTIMATLGLRALPGMEGRDLTGRRKLALRAKADVVGTIGGSASMDLSRVRSQERQASNYLVRRFGRSFFAPGGHANLLGGKPYGLVEVAYRATDPTLYENVDRSSGEIPAYFQAQLLPTGGEMPEAVAISLNGRIVATARPWTSAGNQYVGVVLPSSRFRDGANLIRVFRFGAGQ